MLVNKRKLGIAIDFSQESQCYMQVLHRHPPPNGWPALLSPTVDRHRHLGVRDKCQKCSHTGQ